MEAEPPSMSEAVDRVLAMGPMPDPSPTWR